MLRLGETKSPRVDFGWVRSAQEWQEIGRRSASKQWRNESLVEKFFVNYHENAGEKFKAGPQRSPGAECLFETRTGSSLTSGFGGDTGGV